MGSAVVLQGSQIGSDVYRSNCWPDGAASAAPARDNSGIPSIFCCGHVCLGRDVDSITFADGSVGNEATAQVQASAYQGAVLDHLQSPVHKLEQVHSIDKQHAIPADASRARCLLHGLSPSMFGMRGEQISRDWEGFEEEAAEAADECRRSSVGHDFAPWTQAMAGAVRDDHRVAIWAFPPVTLQLLTCATSDKLQVDPKVGGQTFNYSHIVAALSEVLDRIRPIELILLAMAFSHVARMGASQGVCPGTIDSRHPEVEAFLLKYTCLKSCCSLRSELLKWCPADAGLKWGPVGACSKLDGPDDRGPALTYEVFAGFVGTHAAPLSVIERACLDLQDPCGAPEWQACAGKTRTQRQLEKSLGPLLRGSGTVDGEVSSATRRARAVNRCAVALAIQRNDDSAGVATPRGFTELHTRAASLARVLTMHMTGDIKHWRERCMSSCARFGGG